MRNFLGFIFSLNFLYIILIAAETAAIIFLCLYIPSFMPIAAALGAVWLVTAAAVAAIVSRRGSPEISCALALFAVVLPVAGAVILLVAGFPHRECGTLTVECEKNSGYPAAADGYCGVCEGGYDRADYFASGDEYLNALMKEIERAKERVFLEYFIVGRGEVFSRLLSALKSAHGNGAEIKVIVDGIGSAFRIGRREIKNLKAAGAEVKIFHRLTPFPRSRLNFRDHRKIAAIDGNVAFTGGVNIADEYANIDSPYGFWKDTGVALYGPAAKIFEGMFLSVWLGGYKMKAEEGGKFRCLPYYDSPPHRSGFAENAYVAAIASAKERVHIFTPYFCVSEKISSALAFAALRGVDVRIILPHIPDKKYAFELSAAYALPLMAQGVKFYEFSPGFMHAKSLICDDAAFIGSYNFDYRSFRLNYECGVMLTGDVVERIERDFRDCMRLSVPMTANKVPAAKRVLRFFLKLFAPLI